MANRIVTSIYRSVPFKKELYQLIKIMGMSSAFQGRAYKGVFTLKATDGSTFKMNLDYDLYMEREFFWRGLYGGWEKESLKLWEKLAKQANVIFDVGANSGVFSLLAETLNKTADIYAFEPIKRNIGLLKNNKNANDYKFEIIEFAVSDVDGFCSMYQLPDVANYMTSVNKNRYAENEKVIEVKIPTKSLSTFIKEKKIRKVDLIKLDVEEHELEVLNGLGAYLAEMKPSLLVEIIDDEKAKQIQKICDPLGYLYFYIDEIHPPVRVDKIADIDHHNYLICTAEVARLVGLDQS
jgi:FkbM family methyltransferase